MRLTPQLQIGPDARAADGCVTLTGRRLVVNRHNAGTVHAFAAAAIVTLAATTVPEAYEPGGVGPRRDQTGYEVACAIQTLDRRIGGRPTLILRREPGWMRH